MLTAMPVRKLARSEARKCDHVSGLFALSNAAQRDVRSHVGVELFKGEIGLSLAHRLEARLVLTALDESDADRVDQDVVSGELLGHGLCQRDARRPADRGGYRCRSGGLGTEVGDVDDASAALLTHQRDGQPGCADSGI